jgi:hypothetical protein
MRYSPDDSSAFAALLSQTSEGLAVHRFRLVETRNHVPSNVLLLLKRQTFNTNRAVVVVRLQEVQADFVAYLKQLRSGVARECGFIPFLWGIGIQVVVLADALGESRVNPARYLAVIDNQWAIIQSIFLVDVQRGEYSSARTWGQVFTGKFQDAVEGVLSRQFRGIGPPAA